MEPKNEDKQLILNLINDDEDAFCEIYALYKDRLMYFALKFVKSKESAQDICQDVFIALWQNRHFIDPDTSFSSFLYTIARNRVLYHLRSSQSDEKFRNTILSQAIDYHNETMDTISANELNGIVSLAITKLTERQRQIFEMSRDKGMSHKEIAEALSISIHTVQEHISLALKTIHKVIKKNYGNYSSILLLLICLRG